MKWFISWYKYVWILFLLVPYLIWTFGSILDIITSLIHRIEFDEDSKIFILSHIILFFLGSLILFVLYP